MAIIVGDSIELTLKGGQSGKTDECYKAKVISRLFVK
jgi:hypothetical protein